MTSGKALLAATGLVLAAILLSSAEPTHAQYAPPSSSAVNTTCLSGGDDMVVSAAAYSGGYLMCITTDQDAEGVAVYRESAPGSQQFSLVRGAGGIYFPADLMGMGVPSSDADALYNSIQQQMQSFGV